MAILKNIFGGAKKEVGFFNQQEFTERMAGLVANNLYQYLGKDQPILTEDKTDYVKDGFLTVGAVYECTDLIMKKVIASPALVYEVKSEQKLKMYDNLSKSASVADRAKAAAMKAETLTEVDNKKIQALLDNPNDKQTWDEFVGMTALLYLLDGNSFWYGNAGDARSKKWTEMFALPFTSKDVTITSGGVMDPVTGYKIVWNGGSNKLEFPAEQIEHVKTINPLYAVTGSQLFGISPLRAYLRQLLRERLGNDQANKILNSGGAFGIIAPEHKEDQWTQEQAKAFHERVTDAERSKDKFNRIFPNAVPLKWHQIGLPSTDLQLLDMLKMTREDIYRAYHVPLVFASNEAATYNNLASANKQFIYNAVAPVCEAISRALTNFICKPYLTADKKKYIIRLDYMSLPELSQDMKETAEWLDKSDDLTMNERREAKGYGKINNPAMDKVYINKNKVLIDDVASSRTLNERTPQPNQEQ